MTLIIENGYFVATGGSAMKAVEVLIEHGVPEERIIFINLVCLILSPRSNNILR